MARHPWHPTGPDPGRRPARPHTHGAGSTLEHLLDVSGSAGGARAKAAVALGPDDDVRSGQHDAPSECRLLDVDGLTHFLTRRFDRRGPTARLHVQSLAAIAHLPPEHPGAPSYEQFLQTCLRLGSDVSDRTQAFRQIVFNVAAAMRDDHTKNFAFIYDDRRWRLAPAFDLNFAFLDGGGWPTRHQLTIAGSAVVAGELAQTPLAR